MKIYSDNPMLLNAAMNGAEQDDVSKYFPLGIPELEYHVTMPVDDCPCKFYGMEGHMYIFDKFPRGMFHNPVYHFKSKDDKYDIVIDTKVCRKSFKDVKNDMKEEKWYLYWRDTSEANS